MRRMESDRLNAENADAARKPRNAHDGRMIDLDTPGEAAYWLKWLEASEAAVRDAIRAVGPRAHAVKLYLAEKKGPESG